MTMLQILLNANIFNFVGLKQFHNQLLPSLTTRDLKRRGNEKLPTIKCYLYILKKYYFELLKYVFQYFNKRRWEKTKTSQYWQVKMICDSEDIVSYYWPFWNKIDN